MYMKADSCFLNVFVRLIANRLNQIINYHYLIVIHTRSTESIDVFAE